LKNIINSPLRKVASMECFVTYLKDIEGRIDPHYYKPEFLQLNNKIQSIKFPVFSLGKLSSQIINGIDFRQFEQTGLPYLRVSNIRPLNFDLTDVKFIPNLQISKDIKLNTGDLLITRKGTFGTTVVVDDDHKNMIISSEIFRVVLDSQEVIPEYVAIWLNLEPASRIFSRVRVGGIMGHLSQKVLKQTEIPIPEIGIQKQIIGLVQSAYQQKRQKEAVAQKLLDSIDDHILGELRINIDYKPQLTFVTYSNQVKERLDPLYHCQDVYYFLSNYKGNTTKLGDYIEYAQGGFAAGYSNQDTDGNGILQIRPTNISDDRRLVFNRNIYVKKKATEKQSGDLLAKGELLFNNTNSQELVGKSVVFNLDGQYFCSNHITRIKVKDTALVADYLTAILNLYQRRGVFYRICTNWNNQSGVNVGLLKTVKIPLPTLEVQRIISSEIQSRMNRADELQKQAKAEVDAAKAKVERLILGN